MENTPLCYIVPNCNIDNGRRTATQTHTHNGAHLRIYTNMLTFGQLQTPTTQRYTHGKQLFQDYFKKLKKLY